MMLCRSFPMMASFEDSIIATSRFEVISASLRSVMSRMLHWMSRLFYTR
jgi:hypothetical protein